MSKFIQKSKVGTQSEGHKQYLLRVVKKLTSVLIAGFKKIKKNYRNEPTL